MQAVGGDDATGDDARLIAAAYAAALRRTAPPKPWVARTQAGVLGMIRLIVRDCAARKAATRSSDVWARAPKAANELRKALAAWLEVGGEVVIVGTDGRRQHIRPGGVFRGDEHDKLIALAASIDAAMPILKKRFSPPNFTGRLNSPRHNAVVRLADMFAEGMCAGKATKQLPSVEPDKPLVRFVATLLPKTGAGKMTEGAISLVLRRHWHGPSGWPKGRQNLALRIVVPPPC